MSNSNNNSSNGGCIKYILILAQIVIATMFFTGYEPVAHWAWWQILMPTFIFFGLQIIILFMVGSVMALFASMLPFLSRNK